MTASEKELTYYFVGKEVPPSLDPDSADILRNAVHMDNLIGTLLKERYGNSGRTEPYLAERWDTEPGGRVWNFYLRPGLTCEDGTKIDAPAFVQSFNRILKLFSKREDLAAFNRLKGWTAFKTTNKPLEGVRAVSEHHLQFHFDSAPDGLPEFLSMSFFGFYCDGNFKDGHWKDPKHLIASGPYVLAPGGITSDQVVLVRRKDFPLISEEAPARMTFRTIEAKDASKVPPEGSILFNRQNSEGIRLENFQMYPGAPIFFTGIVLSPHRGAPFDRPENRKGFRAALRKVMKEATFPETGPSKIYRGNSFYFSDQAGSKESADEKVTWKAPRIDKPLLILRFTYTSLAQNLHTEQLVLKTLEQLQWPYELHDPNLKDPDFIRKRNTNRSYDIRLASVDIGGSAENWVINMMFCSQLAISFPDPSGRICKLVKEHEGRAGQYNPAEYLRRFEDIIQDDAAVIPLFHMGSYWLVSPDIDFEQVLAPTMAVPRFDKLRFK